MKNEFEIILTNKQIQENLNLAFVKDDTAGGLCQFIGLVRNNANDQKVIQLEFEAYEPMAKKEIKKIIEEATQKFELLKVSVHHALGIRKVGETCVAISVSSAHRANAFKGCQYIIDELKKTVPIWKKEYFEGGEVWVSAHP